MDAWPLNKMWDGLTPTAKEQLVGKLLPLVIGGILTVIGQKILWPLIASLAQKTKEWLFRRFGGTRLFNWWAIRRYRAAVIRRTGRLTNPWLPDDLRRLEDFFVPVRVGPADLHGFAPKHITYEGVVDVREVFKTLRRFVLVGEPGAGKSTTLQSLALGLSREELPIDPNPLPLFVELKQFARSPALGLQEYLELLLTNDYQFPKPSAFLERQLTAGTFVILLDALDEVGTSQQDTMIDAILSFARRYPLIGLIITCRAAAYSGELDSAVEATVAMAEFTHVQIRRLVSAWRFPAGKSDIELMQILRERPTIFALCRNPLMLTIVISLYARGYRLPQARADFFAICSRAFLEEWDQFRGGILRTNHFDAAHKERILQRLALHKQDDKLQPTDFTESEITSVIRSVLPSLGFTIDKAADILNEIILNSALIIRSGADLLRFSHLAFQEYFAAKEIALSESTTFLISRLRTDRNRWREVSLLYCGLSPDITELINAHLIGQDLQLAGLSVCDARGVDPAMAERVVTFLRDAIVKRADSVSLNSLIRIASQEGRTWSEIALSTVQDLFRAGDETSRWSIIDEMIGTGTTIGISLYIYLIAEPHNLRRLQDSITRIGDPALPVVRKLLSPSTPISKEVRRALLAVCGDLGTPDAALLVLPFLDNDDESLQRIASVSIAKAIRDPETEAVVHFTSLRRTFAAPSERLLQLSEWVWPAIHMLGADRGGISLTCAHIVSVITTTLSNDTKLAEDREVVDRLGDVDLRIAIPTIVELLSEDKPLAMRRREVFPQLPSTASLPLSHAGEALKKDWKSLIKDWTRSEEIGIELPIIGLILLCISATTCAVLLSSGIQHWTQVPPVGQMAVGATLVCWLLVTRRRYYPRPSRSIYFERSSANTLLEVLYNTKVSLLGAREFNVLYEATERVRHTSSNVRKVVDPWKALLTDLVNHIIEPVFRALNPRSFIECLRLCARGIINSSRIETYENFFRDSQELLSLYERKWSVNLNRSISHIAGWTSYLAVMLLPVVIMSALIGMPDQSAIVHLSWLGRVVHILPALAVLAAIAGLNAIGTETRVVIFHRRNPWVRYFRNNESNALVEATIQWIRSVSIRQGPG